MPLRALLQPRALPCLPAPHCAACIHTAGRRMWHCPPTLSNAVHPAAGEFTGAALAWLESGGKADVDTLVKELVPAQPALLTIERLLEGGQAPLAAPTSGA